MGLIAAKTMPSIQGLGSRCGVIISSILYNLTHPLMRSNETSYSCLLKQRNHTLSNISIVDLQMLQNC